ncbi:MAG: methyl-accepting chemotaxis protein [Bacillota bacterium]|nr:methyl-accepting chemotaxis protein [Bacillota bacterium]MDK2960436.1 methyl-accepting chemotaxis protein [Bacillota bacterium]
MTKVRLPKFRIPLPRLGRRRKDAQATPRRERTGSIMTGILAGYFILIALIIAIGGYSYWGMQRVLTEYQDIIDRAHPYVMAIADINSSLRAQLMAQRTYFLTGDDQYTLRAELDSNAVKEAIKKAESYAQEGEEKNLLTQIESIHKNLMEQQKNAFSTYAAGNREQAIQEGLAGVDETLKRLTANFNVLQGINQRRVDEARQAAQAAAQRTLHLVLVLALVGAATGLLVGFVLARRTVRPLRELAQAAKTIAAGDLTLAVRAQGRNEIGQLAAAFSDMVNSLRHIITEVRTSVLKVSEYARQLTASAEETTRATEQIASSVQEVAEGAEQQVREVTDAAATIKQMAAAMDQVAESAQAVAASSQETARLAEEGKSAIESVIQQNNVVRESMANLSDLIRELGQRSREIGQIVEVITGIADQTNLLALNAAIEAARAGEQGRGFAVVADEVRKLAEQSAQAAKQIAGLVERTQNDTGRATSTMEAGSAEVASGSKLLESARQMLEKIFAAVEKVDHEIQEVSAAAQEMAASSSRVVAATENISRIAENTSAGTENIAAATEEQTAAMEEISSSAQVLADMARKLEQAVERFKL